MLSLQHQVKVYCKQQGIDKTSSIALNDFVTEAKNLAKVVENRDNNNLRPLETDEEIRQRFGQTLLALIMAANYLDIDLSSAATDLLNR